MKKNGSLKKILSAVIALTMAMSLVLPITVYATVATPVAVATVIENGGGGQTKTITVTFAEEVADLGAVLDTDISVAGKTFGASTMVLDAVTNKDLVITLASDATVAVGEDITFANDKIAKADDLTDFFNGDVAITGSLDNATIDYSGIVPGDATITVDGYLTNPTSVGTGTFNYTLTRTNYVTKVSSFTITASDLGNTYVVTDSMEKNAADYTAIDAKIAEAGTYLAANYTAASYAALQTALTNANAVDRSLKFDSQSTVDALTTALQAAIDGLVAKKTVNFMAVAVADDADVNYAKATKIVLVFAEPIATSADILSNLSIKSDIASAVWVDAQNTVYELTIKPTANLANGTVITYTTNDAIKTKLGVVLDTTSATVVGNLEEASALVTATDMSATIVKSSGKPGVVAGDKIVIVFNAPVNDKPASITVNGMTANAVASTNNTVYEIVLAGTESVSNSTTLTYSTMSTGLNGSFGSAVAPKVKKVIAVDNDGTANTKNDQIIISFDRPTNGVAISSSALSNIVTKVGQGLGGDATAAWDTSKTELTITIGQEATIGDDVIINLGTLGIKDEYNLVAYVPVGLSVEGSFGTTVTPKITRVIAFTQNGKHKIRAFFNTLVEPKGAVDIYVKTFNEGASSGSWTHNGISYYDIVLGDGHDEFVTNTFDIFFEGTLVDSETKKAELVNATAKIQGGFEKDIEPEILSLTAYSQDGSGVAKAGDNIILVLNSEVTSVTASVGTFTTTDNVTWKYASNGEIAIGQTINFTIGALGKSYARSATVSGNYGYIVEPKLLSVTAYSKDGSGVAKAGDEIIVVFDSPVTGVVSTLGPTTTTDNIIWKITLSSNDSVTIGTTLTFNVNSVATGKAYVLSKDLAGSFGKVVVPEILSATAYSKDGSGVAKAGDEIILVFNSPVTGVASTLGATSTGNNMIWKITLASNNSVTVGATLTFNVNSVATGKAYALSKALGGSFGSEVAPKILSATAYSKDGSGVAKAGDKITVIFDTPVTGVTSTLGSVTTDDNIMWEITLSSNDSVAIGDTLTFNVNSVATGKAYALSKALAGSFGSIQENKVISTNVYYSEAKKAEIIDLVFSAETNGNSGLITTPTVVEKLVENNPKLDIVSASFVDNYTFRIQLGAGSTIIEGDDITLKNLNITDKKTGKVIADNDLKHAVSGAVIPVVQKAEVVDTVITVTFSARTNGAGISNILAQKALYGTGVTAEWQSNNTKLVITMSNDNTMSNDAYIVLNGLGIKDGFSGTYDIVGQYKIDTTNLTKKTLNITSVFVKANDTDNAPRADVTKGLAGDNIIVKFEDVTDKLAGSDASANIILDDAGDSFGTGYTAIWSDSKTIEVTLGTDPVITNSSKVIIKDVKFANGTGYLASGGATQVTKELTGQFDGKRYWITNVAKTTTKERVRVTGTVSTEYNGVKPFVVCQAMTASNTVLSISAVKLNDVASSDVVFDFSATNVAKIKMFVVDGDYADETATITPLSEVVDK